VTLTVNAILGALFVVGYSTARARPSVQTLSVGPVRRRDVSDEPVKSDADPATAIGRVSPT